MVDEFHLKSNNDKNKKCKFRLCKSPLFEKLTVLNNDILNEAKDKEINVRKKSFTNYPFLFHLRKRQRNYLKSNIQNEQNIKSYNILSPDNSGINDPHYSSSKLCQETMNNNEFSNLLLPLDDSISFKIENRVRLN